MLRVATITTALLSTLALKAQSPSLYVFGTVRKYENRDSIPFPSVHLQELGDTALPEPVHTNARGRYELELTKEGIFWILFDAAGKVGKRVEIDTHGARPERADGYGMNIDITLFDSIPDVDFSFFNNAIAKVGFDAAKDEFRWDLAYTQGIEEEIVRMMKEYDESRKQPLTPSR